MGIMKGGDTFRFEYRGSKASSACYSTIPILYSEDVLVVLKEKLDPVMVGDCVAARFEENKALYLDIAEEVLKDAGVTYEVRPTKTRITKKDRSGSSELQRLQAEVATLIQQNAELRQENAELKQLISTKTQPPLPVGIDYPEMVGHYLKLARQKPLGELFQLSSLGIATDRKGGDVDYVLVRKVAQALKPPDFEKVNRPGKIFYRRLQ